MITGCGWSFVGREQHEKRRGRGAGLEKKDLDFGWKNAVFVYKQQEAVPLILLRA